MTEKTVFVVGSCRIVGGCVEGVRVRRLSKRQMDAAKVVLNLGLSREEWDALEEQLCQERHWRQQMALSRRATIRGAVVDRVEPFDPSALIARTKSWDDQPVDGFDEVS